LVPKQSESVCQEEHIGTTETPSDIRRAALTTEK